MKRQVFTKLTNEQIVAEFLQCAHLWGDALEAGENRQASHMVNRLGQLEREVKARGPQARLKLAPFMDSLDPGIRYFAAHALGKFV